MGELVALARSQHCRWVSLALASALVTPASASTCGWNLLLDRSRGRRGSPARRAGAVGCRRMSSGGAQRAGGASVAGIRSLRGATSDDGRLCSTLHALWPVLVALAVALRLICAWRSSLPDAGRVACGCLAASHRRDRRHRSALLPAAERRILCDLPDRRAVGNVHADRASYVGGGVLRRRRQHAHVSGAGRTHEDRERRPGYECTRRESAHQAAPARRGVRARRGQLGAGTGSAHRRDMLGNEGAHVGASGLRNLAKLLVERIGAGIGHTFRTTTVLQDRHGRMCGCSSRRWRSVSTPRWISIFAAPGLRPSATAISAGCMSSA